MKVIIDRFEGDYAIVELDEGKILELPKELIPEAEEGDVINIEILKEETNKRKEQIKNKAIIYRLESSEFDAFLIFINK